MQKDAPVRPGFALAIDKNLKLFAIGFEFLKTTLKRA